MYSWLGWLVSPRPKKAIQSLRLRLHSGLRQQGVGLWSGVCGMAEAMPFRSCLGNLFAHRSASRYELFDDNVGGGFRLYIRLSLKTLWSLLFN
jgi:hypothetical protein